jgi:hypothetical protein
MSYETNLELREKIDFYLESLAKLEATLGTDSTKEEIQKVNTEKQSIMQKIKELDSAFYLTIAPNDK